jgi:hypothetical protein
MLYGNHRFAHVACWSSHYYEFVSRAEEHMDVVRPFFPALVVFLPSHRAGV